MENLTIDDQCDCGPQKVTPPLELVFLLDGSDSFNTEVGWQLSLNSRSNYKNTTVYFRRKVLMEKSRKSHLLNTQLHGLPIF